MPVEKNTVFICINRSVDGLKESPVNSSSPISHANATDAVGCVCVCGGYFYYSHGHASQTPVQDLPNNSLCWLHLEA